MLWFLFLSTLAFYAFWKIYKTFTFWKRLGVEQPPFSDIFGFNWHQISGKYSFAELTNVEYEKYEDRRYFPLYQFQRPTIMIRDPELIKTITVKDFDHFVDHQVFIPPDADPLWGKNLVALNGDQWREMRATLSPTFTSSKMRSMFVLIVECAERFVDYFDTKSNDTIELEMKDTFRRCANDVIASSAFGISCDSLRKRDNEFFLKTREATDFSGFWTNLKFVLAFASPQLFTILRLRLFSKKIANFFSSVVKETINLREKEGIYRPDLIHLLMEARKGRLKYEEKTENQNETGFATVSESQIGQSSFAPKRELSDLDITAQALIFFFAGFDTVSTAMSFMAYELAVNPDIQEKLYREIEETFIDTNKKVTYETLLKMKYLDMVVSETLRKWPPSVATDRVCVKPYTIKPEHPDEKPVPVEKGVVIFLPQYSIHRDEKYYPNPERFDPERFSDENKKNINPYAYIPFGAGPRNCIGSRFALLEMKAVFVNLLSKFEIVPTKKTPIPLKLVKREFTLLAEGGFWVGFKKRCK